MRRERDGRTFQESRSALGGAAPARNPEARSGKGGHQMLRLLGMPKRAKGWRGGHQMLHLLGRWREASSQGGGREEEGRGRKAEGGRKAGGGRRPTPSRKSKNPTQRWGIMWPRFGIDSCELLGT